MKYLIALMLTAAPAKLASESRKVEMLDEKTRESLWIGCVQKKDGGLVCLDMERAVDMLIRKGLLEIQCLDLDAAPEVNTDTKKI